jgi:hypothetical protein
LVNAFGPTLPLIFDKKMETQSATTSICDFLGLEDTLKQFKPSHIPSRKDVIQNYFFHLWSQPQDNRISSVAAWRTTEASIDVCTPSYIPLRTKNTIKSIIDAFLKKYVRYAKKVAKSFPEKVVKF